MVDGRGTTDDGRRYQIVFRDNCTYVCITFHDLFDGMHPSHQLLVDSKTSHRTYLPADLQWACFFYVNESYVERGAVSSVAGLK